MQDLRLVRGRNLMLHRTDWELQGDIAGIAIARPVYQVDWRIRIMEKFAYGLRVRGLHAASGNSVKLA